MSNLNQVHLKDLFQKPKLLMKLRTCLLGLLSIVILMSCDKIPSGVIDVKTTDIKIVKIDLPESFVYSSADSLLKISIQFSKYELISKAWLVVKTFDGKIRVYNNLPLADDGNMSASGDLKASDGIFNAKIPMSKKFVNGKYIVEIFAEDNIHSAPENQLKLGEQLFTYNNFQNNLPPVLSNLILQTSVNRGEPFIFSVKAEDPNGLLDILQVTFKLFRPDGTVVIPNSSTPSIDYFLMVDNGDSNLGDQTAGDGVFSFKNTFGATSAVGNWRFEFQAKDRAGNVSNIIKQSLEVK